MALYINGNKISGGGGNSNMQELTQEEYDELTTEEKNNGTVYYITDVNGDGESFQPIIYSENEREIGVWIDGKPLYQKTFELTIPDGSGAYEHEFTEAAIPNLDKAVKTSYSLGIGERAYVPWYSQATVILDEQKATGVTFYFGSNSYAGRIIYYTVCYTKTTDTAGSGTWTPQGVPAVHYSTDEQIIGTWIDGSTLYEKTIILSTPLSMNANSWGTVSTLTEQINIVSAEGIYNTGTEYAFYPIGANCDTNKELTILNYRNVQNSINIIILRYTKITS